MAISLNRVDFAAIGQLAKHCNLEKLEIAVNEAILFDLKPLLCDLFYEVEDNWGGTGDFNSDFNSDFSINNQMDEDYSNLIYAHEYIGCNDKTKSHQGLRDVLARYAYARYVILNPFDDTPNGGVTKNNEWSIPKPYNELKQVSDRYRTMAYQQWLDVEAFICFNRETYTDANLCNCKPCGCNGCCGSKTKAKGYGIKGRNISK